jgi:magnesium-protoporphyrin IX monomethyl ester (oxidative) cyclase
MARDEARHAGFINDALREAGGRGEPRLPDPEEEVHLLPAEVHLLRHLSVGKDRLRALHHDLPPPGGEPGHRFHPIFKWFEEWCNDEFRHGEAFALLMKTDPKLTASSTSWWIKFFLTAVYSTMYVRDHQRPAFHAALGVDPDWYAQEVFTKTSELSKQVFPITSISTTRAGRRG